MDNFSRSSFYLQKAWQDLAGFRRLPSNGFGALGAHLLETVGRVLQDAGLALYFAGEHIFWGSQSDGEPTLAQPRVGSEGPPVRPPNTSLSEASEIKSPLSFTHTLSSPWQQEVALPPSSPYSPVDWDATLALIATELGMGLSQAERDSIRKILYTYQSHPDTRIDNIPALHMSCEARCPTVASLILKAWPLEATINYQKPLGHPINPGSTALMLACQQGPVELVELLLAKGAKMELLNREGLGAVDFLLEDGDLCPWRASYPWDLMDSVDPQSPLFERHAKYMLLLEARAKQVCDGDSFSPFIESLMAQAHAEWGLEEKSKQIDCPEFWRAIHERWRTIHKRMDKETYAACDEGILESVPLSATAEDDREDSAQSSSPRRPVCFQLEEAPLTYKLCALGYLATAKLALLMGLPAKDLRWYSEEDHMSILHYGALYADPVLMHLAFLHGAQDQTPRGQRTVRQLFETRGDHATAPFRARLQLTEAEDVRKVAELLERYGCSKVSGQRSRAGSRI